MKARTFSTLTVKNDPKTLSHCEYLEQHAHVSIVSKTEKTIKLEIPGRAYQFAETPKKIKDALGL